MLSKINRENNAGEHYTLLMLSYFFHFEIHKRPTSPQYSEMKSFFWTDSLMKVPHPATSDGANRRC